MTNIAGHLEELLLAAAVLQVAVALLNLGLVPLMRWQADLAKVSPLVREVFYVHQIFISITLVIFGALTWRFASEMALGGEPVFIWLACAIGTFWSVRTVFQWAIYSWSHWWGRPGRTLVHVLLTVIYGGMACVYLFAALAR